MLITMSLILLLVHTSSISPPYSFVLSVAVESMKMFFVFPATIFESLYLSASFLRVPFTSLRCELMIGGMERTRFLLS
jgi:hypothetical protein